MTIEDILLEVETIALTERIGVIKAELLEEADRIEAERLEEEDRLKTIRHGVG